MAQNAALRCSPASGNVLVEAAELFHRLPRVVQLDLDVLALLVRCRVILPLKHPNTPLLILGDKRLASDLGLDRLEVLVERRIAEERDVITALAVVLTPEVFVLVLVQREDDVASGNEEEPLGIQALGNEEAAGRCILGTDGKTERSGKRFTDRWVGRVGGRGELGTGLVGNDRLTDLEVADADDICTRPLHLHRVQKAVELEDVFRSEGRLG